MLEVIGFLVWIFFTLGLTAIPFLLLGFSGLGGGDKSDFWIGAFIACLAIYSWYKILSSISVTIN